MEEGGGGGGGVWVVTVVSFSWAYKMCIASVGGAKEGRKEVFYLTTHSTYFIYGYMHMVKDYSDS